MNAIRGQGLRVTAIPLGTVWLDYDDADRCLVSACGWRLPVIACMMPGQDQLTFAVDAERNAVNQPDLHVVTP